MFGKNINTLSKKMIETWIELITKNSDASKIATSRWEFLQEFCMQTKESWFASWQWFNETFFKNTLTRLQDI